MIYITIALINLCFCGGISSKIKKKSNDYPTPCFIEKENEIIDDKEEKNTKILEPEDLKYEDNIIYNKRSSIKQDIQLLKYALENGYIGFDVLDKNIKQNFFEKINRLETQTDHLSSIRFFHELEFLFKDIPDNHLSLVHTDPMGDGLMIMNNDLRQKNSIGVNYGINKKKDQKNNKWVISSLNLEGNTIPVISLFEFPEENSSQWDGLNNALEKSLLLPALIIDLRGSRGGSLKSALKIAKKISGNTYQDPVKYIACKNTPVSQIFILNRCYTQKLDPFDRMALYYKYMIKTSKKECELQYDTSSFSYEDMNLNSVNNTIIILIDRNTKSAAEFFLIAIKNALNIKIIGENSNGCLNFGTIGILILPHSLIQVNIPTCFFKTNTEDSLETIGITPDIISPDGEDAIESAKKYITEMHHGLSAFL